PCELKDYPDTENGEPAPHHWQFERTPLRQLAQWVPWMQSDIERVERELSYFVRQQTIHHWR
ncbi:Protein C25H3.9 a, partial [Aphelenchoides avenae]